MRAFGRVFLSIAAVGLACATVFFAYYGIRVVYAVLTFEGEGSLGHVGMYIAAGLFPALALFCGALTYLAWRMAGRLAASER